MKRWNAITLTLVLGSGCTVSGFEASTGTIGEGNSSADVESAPGGGHVVNAAALRRYAIEELPTAVAGGHSRANDAVCQQRSVVGTASVDSPNQIRGVVMDASGAVTQLGTLGGATSEGLGGNASGAIVGVSSAGTAGHAFLYRDGVMKDLGTLGGAFSAAFAINSQDQIVGQSTLVTGGDVPSHATLWEDCVAIDLGTLGNGIESFARDINEAGVIVGTSSVPDQPGRGAAVVWRDRVIERLDDGGAHISQATAINDAGTVVGFLTFANGLPFHAVMWRNGAMTDLGSFGNSAFALGVNNQNEVVGHSFDPALQRAAAFLYTNGELLRLEAFVDAPGWTLLSAEDVCDDGRIIGNGWLFGESRGFVLTPLPPGP